MRQNEWERLNGDEREQFRDDPKNFVFNYHEPDSNYPDGGSSFSIGLKFSYKEIGGLDYNSYLTEWMEEIGLAELMEGIFQHDINHNDNDIINKLLKLGVEFDVDYK